MPTREELLPKGRAERSEHAAGLPTCAGLVVSSPLDDVCPLSAPVH